MQIIPRLSLAALLLASPLAAQEAGDVVATVNGTEITLGEMIATRAGLPDQYNSLPADVLFDGILEQLIQQQLLADELDATPERLRITLMNEERSLKAGEVVNEVYASVDEAAVQAAYDEQFGSAEPETEWNASHILVETIEEAEAVIERVTTGGEEFADVARDVSTGPSGPNGGQLGWFSAGMMVPPFEEAVAELEVGEVSGPVETQFGWHVVTLNDTRDAEPPALEQVRGQIEGQLQQEALAARLEALTEAAEIAQPEAGAFDAELINNLDLLGD